MPGKPTPLATLLSVLALVALCGCGGGAGGGTAASASSPGAPATPYATVLSYSNPPLGGYSLQAEPASNGTAHLVLDLIGPAGTVAQGVSFFLTADATRVAWSKGSGTLYATPGAAFNLGSAPQAFIAKASATGDLQVGIYQKSGTASFGVAPLVSVALDLIPGMVLQGSAVALAPTVGQQAVLVDAAGLVQPFPAAIAVGALAAH